MTQNYRREAGSRRKRGANARIDEDEADTRRERRASGQLTASPYPSSTRSVYPATARRRRLNLQGDLLRVAYSARLGAAARHPDRGAEVSRE